MSTHPAHTPAVEEMQGSNYWETSADAGPCARCHWLLEEELQTKATEASPIKRSLPMQLKCKNLWNTPKRLPSRSV